MSDVQLHVNEQPQTLRDWLETQDLSNREKRLWNFHRWMREETQLGKGSTVEYRKKIHQLMTEDGVLDVDQSDLGCRERSAYNKFQEFVEADLPVESTKGDIGE